MTISLHDATVRSFLQTLDAVSGVMAKGLAHCREASIDPAEIVDFRFAPDMLPFSYQIQSVCHHSRGALEGCEAGVFAPPTPTPASYEELQAKLAQTREALSGWTPERTNALAGRDVVFKLGERALPFEAADFLLSFSLPNFYFHATTAYDILRHKGAPLAKRDYLGRIRLKMA